MITRAIIVDKDLNIGKLKVKIPILDGIGDGGISTNWASIIYTPGLDIDYQVGDIVIVGFEDNDVGSPIVLGFLKLKNTKIDSRIYETVKELKVEDNFLAPLNTTIGKTSYQKLFSSIESTLTTDDKFAADTPILSSQYVIDLLLDTNNVIKSFVVNDQFDSTNLIVSIQYANNQIENIEDFQIIPPDMATTGSKIVWILYKGKTNFYNIEVIPLQLTELTISGDYKTSYIVGETFDKTGLIATVTYNNGDIEDVTSKIIISNTEPLTIDDREITFIFSNDYGEVTSTIQITVTEESSGT